jgi:hypothetical protein
MYGNGVCQQSKHGELMVAYILSSTLLSWADTAKEKDKKNALLFL